MLPELKGSEKQILWANAIRKEALDWSEINIEKLRKQGLSEDYLKEIRQAFYQIINEPKRTTAHYWIDNRQIYEQDEAPYEAEITDEMKKILQPMKEQFQAEEAPRIAAKQAEKKGVVIRPSGYYVSRNTSLDEIETAEAEDAIFAQECEEAEKSLTLEWTAKSGQEISIKLRIDDHLREYFEVRVSGARMRRLDLTDLEMRDDVPGIIATLGNIGLTKEHYDKLMAMIKVPEDDEEIEVCSVCGNASCMGCPGRKY